MTKLIEEEVDEACLFGSFEFQFNRVKRSALSRHKLESDPNSPKDGAQ